LPATNGTQQQGDCLPPVVFAIYKDDMFILCLGIGCMFTATVSVILTWLTGPLALSAL